MSNAFFSLFFLYKPFLQIEMQDHFLPQQEFQEIDERIDVHDYFSRTEQKPLQSPDLMKYLYMAQVLRTRNSPGSNGFFEDYMFKEQVVASQQKAIEDSNTL